MLYRRRRSTNLCGCCVTRVISGAFYAAGRFVSECLPGLPVRPTQPLPPMQCAKTWQVQWNYPTACCCYLGWTKSTAPCALKLRSEDCPPDCLTVEIYQAKLSKTTTMHAFYLSTQKRTNMHTIMASKCYAAAVRLSRKMTCVWLSLGGPRG